MKRQHYWLLVNGYWFERNEAIEVGSRNSEGGIEKNSEFGIRKAERGSGNRKEMGRRNAEGGRTTRHRAKGIGQRA